MLVIESQKKRTQHFNGSSGKISWRPFSFFLSFFAGRWCSAWWPGCRCGFWWRSFFTVKNQPFISSLFWSFICWTSKILLNGPSKNLPSWKKIGRLVLEHFWKLAELEGFWNLAETHLPNFFQIGRVLEGDLKVFGRGDSNFLPAWIVFWKMTLTGGGRKTTKWVTQGNSHKGRMKSGSNFFCTSSTSSHSFLRPSQSTP